MSPTKKIFLSSFLLGLFTISVITFLIYPLFKEIKKNSEGLVLEKKKIISLAREKENLKKMEGIFKTYQSDLEKIENLFVDPEVPIEFISFLEKTAKDCKVSIKISSTSQKEIKEDPWPSIFFQIDLKSSFSNLSKFLEKLNSSIYLIEIQNLNVSRLTESDLRLKEGQKLSLDDVKATFSLKVFTSR